MKALAVLGLVAVLVADNGVCGAEATIYPHTTAETLRGAQSEPDEVLAVTEEFPAKHLYGTCTITFYDNGACCCGQWAGGNTASGTVPTANRTAASNVLPFGTRILIDRQEYIIEDRGDGNMDAFWIDVFVPTHEEAIQRGMQRKEVWIIDG